MVQHFKGNSLVCISTEVQNGLYNYRLRSFREPKESIRKETEWRQLFINYGRNFASFLLYTSKS